MEDNRKNATPDHGESLGYHLSSRCEPRWYVREKVDTNEKELLDNKGDVSTGNSDL